MVELGAVAGAAEIISILFHRAAQVGADPTEGLETIILFIYHGRDIKPDELSAGRKISCQSQIITGGRFSNKFVAEISYQAAQPQDSRQPQGYFCTEPQECSAWEFDLFGHSLT